jgi:hypothetical protein
VMAAVELRYMPASAAAADELEAMAAVGPGDLSETLNRTTRVNQLYATRVPCARREQMADRISTKWAGSPPADTADIAAASVVEIAAAHSGDRRYLSFASKFVHFFGNPQFAVPIWDTWARRRLRYHIAGVTRDYYYGRPWSVFYADADALRNAVDASLSFRDLDAYLWLSAQLGSPTAGEVAGLFGSDGPEIMGLVATMMGTA